MIGAKTYNGNQKNLIHDSRGNGIDLKYTFNELRNHELKQGI